MEMRTWACPRNVEAGAPRRPLHGLCLLSFAWALMGCSTGVDLGCCHLVVPKTEPGEVTTSFWASTVSIRFQSYQGRGNEPGWRVTCTDDERRKNPVRPDGRVKSPGAPQSICPNHVAGVGTGAENIETFSIPPCLQ